MKLKLLESFSVLLVLTTACTSIPIRSDDPITCSGGNKKLVAKGLNVKISDVLKAPCMKEAIYIEVFALNKLSIDADIDKSGKQAQIILIAPAWEIRGNREIKLSGIPLKVNETAATEGKHGSPGNPGQSSGSIFTMGNTFSNDRHLKILVNGGDGGPGLPGANGKSGIGKGIVPRSICHYKPSDWSKMKQIKKVRTDPPYTENGYSVIIYYLEINHTKVQDNEDGYHGGAGGFGGKSGEAHFHGYNRDPKFFVSKKEGKNGEPGKGGKGGESKTAHFEIQCTQKTRRNEETIVLTEMAGKDIPMGGKGIDGKNSEGKKNATVPKLHRPYLTINNFEDYVNKHLKGNSQGEKLRKFLRDIKSDKRILSLYDTFGLINFLKRIELEYLRTRNRSHQLDVIQALMNRVIEYMKTQEDSDHRAALRTLYTSASSKLINLKDNENLPTVVDLLPYLDGIKEDFDALRDMQEIERQMNMTKYQKEYADALNKKIISAVKLINTVIKPEIEASVEDLNSAGKELISDIKDNLNAEIQDLNKLKKQRAKLESTMQFNTILNSFRLLGTFTSFFGPIGKGIEMIISTGVGLAQEIHDGLNPTRNGLLIYDGTKSDLRNCLTAFKSEVAGVNDFLSEDAKHFQKQLEHVENFILIGEDSNVRAEISSIKRELKRILNSKVVDPSEIEKLRKRFKEFIQNTSRRNDFTEVSSTTEKPDPRIKRMKRINNAMDLARAGAAIFSQIAQDKAAIAEVTRAIQASEGEISHWLDMVRVVHQQIIPMIKELQKLMLSIMDCIAGKSHVDLDVMKWKVQSRIKSVKIAFTGAAAGTNMIDTFAQSVEKLCDAMTILIDIYNRIDSYSDKAKFAIFFGKMISNEQPDIKDPILKAATLDLKKIIHSNLIYEQFETAMHALKQNKFPFAQYLSAHYFPADITFDRPDLLLKNTEDQINKLRKSLKTGEFQVGKYNSAIVQDVIFGQNSPVHCFYRWTDPKNINKLLKGEEIQIKADIRKGLNLNAVKFNQLELKLLSEDTGQTNHIGDEYDVYLSMMGNAYYRCGKRIYYVSVDENIVLRYSVKKGSDGKPMRVNDVYKKISKNTPFLSPYALWKIQIKKQIHKPNLYDSPPGNVTNISDKKLYLELQGRGQYFDDNNKFTAELCTKELDKFYHLDDIQSTVPQLLAIP